jgi:hypothetical protein
MNRFYASAFFLFCFAPPLQSNYLTPTTLKKYEGALLGRAHDLRKGLKIASSPWIPSWASHSQTLASFFEGIPVSQTELDMLDMFMYFPDTEALPQDYQAWLGSLKPECFAEINKRLDDGKKNNYDSDLFNINIQHQKTVERFFSGKRLTIAQLNKQIEAVPVPDYKDEMFLRLTCDVVYRLII